MKDIAVIKRSQGESLAAQNAAIGNVATLQDKVAAVLRADSMVSAAIVGIEHIEVHVTRDNEESVEEALAVKAIVECRQSGRNAYQIEGLIRHACESSGLSITTLFKLQNAGTLWGIHSLCELKKG